ncbi:MAG: hypothetical protein LIQ30_06225 [Planctomycetes bacterium]|nr:hypothetical protein [Planctomycetota bacterium]MCC8115893.1 hypothetical protein [Planctomycetota bacterium]MCD7895738.1 hypothetical protein [Planctomycetaceae bacterium]
MNVNSMGGMPLASRVQSPQRQMSMGGLTAKQQADNESAKKALPLRAAESAGRASVEAKGMFVDTYA